MNFLVLAFYATIVLPFLIHFISSFSEGINDNKLFLHIYKFVFLLNIDNLMVH